MGQLQVFIAALRAVIGVMQIVLIIRVLLEFKAVSRASGLFKFIYSVSEPLLSPVRKILLVQSKKKSRSIDISPLVVIIVLYLLSKILRNV